MGLGIGAYEYLYPQVSLVGQVLDAIDILSPFPGIILWLDVEEPGPWDPDALLEAAVVAEVAGFGVGIYTQASKWIPYLGNSTLLSGYPLWYAHHDNDPSFRDFVPFGGWLTPSVKQYLLDIPGQPLKLCGVAVDRNWAPQK